MKLITTISILIAFCGSILAQVNEKPITLTTPTGNIEGSVICPDTDDTVPLVLLIAGSGPTDRNGNNPMMSNNSLKMLAQALSENGIATVRYDKRGIAESAEAGLTEANLRFENYVDDAAAWIDLLSKDSRFSELIIAGHSEGSLIGMIAAQKDKVSKYISIAGIGSPAGDIVYEQIKAQAPALADQALPIIKKLESGELPDTIPPMLLSIFRPSVQPYIISWFKYDPLKELATLNKPILIVQGTTDIQVSVAEAEKLATANKKVEKYILEGMNHVLKAAPEDKMKNIHTYSDPNLPLFDGFMDIVVLFVKR